MILCTVHIVIRPMVSGRVMGSLGMSFSSMGVDIWSDLWSVTSYGEQRDLEYRAM